MKCSRRVKSNKSTVWNNGSRGIYQDDTVKFTDMNPAAERIMGYTFEEIHGNTHEDPICESIHPDWTDFLGEKHPSMVAMKTGVEDVVMGAKYPNRKAYTWLKY